MGADSQKGDTRKSVRPAPADVEVQDFEEDAFRLCAAAGLVSLTFIIAVGAMNLAPPQGNADLYLANWVAGGAVAISMLVGTFARHVKRLPLLATTYQVGIALAISLTEVLITYDTLSVVRGISWVCLWIVLYPLVVATPPGVTFVAALLSAAMGPLAFVLASALGVPIQDTRTITFLLLPNFFAAGLAIVLGRLVDKLRSDATRGRRLGAYRLERRIGRGAVGEVWLASHQMLARKAAVKLLPSTRPASSSQTVDAEAQFLAEARATAALTSAHTVHVYDYGLTKERHPYYAMEFLDGANLDVLVQTHGALPPARVAHFLVQACESLAEAHEKGLVHRDVKPSNLFAAHQGTRSDYLKVLDFGLAASVHTGTPDSEQTHSAAFVGTPAYAAPEVLSGAAPDARSDVYSLGCVAYYLLTGRTVYAAESLLAMTQAHRDEPIPSFPSDVPPSLDAAVRGCLAKRAAERPTAATLIEALSSFADEWTMEAANAWWSEHGETTSVRDDATAPREIARAELYGEPDGTRGKARS